MPSEHRQTGRPSSALAQCFRLRVVFPDVTTSSAQSLTARPGKHRVVVREKRLALLASDQERAPEKDRNLADSSSADRPGRLPERANARPKAGTCLRKMRLF